MKQNILDQIQGILFFTIIFLCIFMNYNGNYHSEYVNIWSYLDGQFENDIYEKNSLFTKTSIFYPTLKFLGLNFQNDIQGLVFHYLISIFSGYFLFKIVKKFLEINSTNISILIVLSLSIFDNVLLHTAKSGWVVQHTLVPSHLALCFSFYFLWQVLNKNKFNLLFSSILFLLISIKVAWFMIACALIFFYSDKKKITDLYWLIPCFLFVLYLLINFNGGSQNSEIKLELFNEVIRREGNEVALHLQSKIKLFFTFISFFIYYYFLKFVENKTFKNFAKYLFYSSIMLFVVGGLYIKYGHLIFPDPKLAMLTPVRSMYLYQLFFGILFCNFILKKFTNSKMLYVFLTAPFFISYNLKGIIVYLTVILVLYLFSFLKISKKISFSYLISLVLFLIVINSSINRIKKYDFFTFAKLNHWSTQMPDNTEFKEFFFNIRACDDFMIHDELNFNRSANFFASKSRFFHRNSVILGLNHSILKETLRREDVLNLVKNDKKKINLIEINNISKENFLYLSIKNTNKNFFSIEKEFGNLIFIFDENELNKLKKNCKKLFNN